MVDFPQEGGGGGGSTEVEPLLTMVGGQAYVADTIVETDTGYMNPMESETEYTLSNMTQGSSRVTSYVETGSDILPTFSDYTSGAFTVSASDEHVTLQSWRAGDDTNAASGDCWTTLQTGYNQWWKADCGSAQQVAKYTVTTRNDATYTNAPKSFSLEGSATGAFAGEETVLDSQTNQFVGNIHNIKNTYTLAAVANYRYYRVHITDGWQNNYISVGEFELLNPAGVDIASMTQDTNTFAEIPTGLKAIILIKDIGGGAAITINSNLIVEASDDDESTWTALTMSQFAQVDTDIWQYNSTLATGWTDLDLSIRVRTVDASGGVPAIDIYSSGYYLT